MVHFNQQIAALKLGVSVTTLERWRREGTGPEYIKLNGWRIYYTEEALEAYLEDCTVKTAKAVCHG